jgi:hypothetical protein
MAQGEVFVFDSFIEYMMLGTIEGVFDFGDTTPDTVMCAIINNTTPPTVTTADPCWGGGGTTNFTTWEETGTNYPAGGRECTVVNINNNAGVIELDFGDPAVWTQIAGNPTACWWGIVYDDTTANKNCIGYVDLGGVFDATTGDLTITWGNPFATINQA